MQQRSRAASLEKEQIPLLTIAYTRTSVTREAALHWQNLSNNASKKTSGFRLPHRGGQRFVAATRGLRTAPARQPRRPGLGGGTRGTAAPDEKRCLHTKHRAQPAGTKLSVTNPAGCSRPRPPSRGGHTHLLHRGQELRPAARPGPARSAPLGLRRLPRSLDTSLSPPARGCRRRARTRRRAELPSPAGDPPASAPLRPRGRPRPARCRAFRAAPAAIGAARRPGASRLAQPPAGCGGAGRAGRCQRAVPHPPPDPRRIPAATRDGAAGPARCTSPGTCGCPRRGRRGGCGCNGRQESGRVAGPGLANWAHGRYTLTFFPQPRSPEEPVRREDAR